MSNISTAFDALKARLAAVLPNHFELTTPESPEKNPEPRLAKGYGITIPSTERDERAINCAYALNQAINIVLTRRYYATELDFTKKEDAKKLLLEDRHLLVKDFGQDPTLSASNAVAQFSYEGDQGITFVFNEDKPYYMMIINCRLEIFESLS